MALEIKSKEDVLKLQEAVAEKLKRGEIIEKDFILLFENFKDMEIPENEVISKNIKFLEDHYEKLSKEEKYLLINLLFGLNILNGKAKEGLRDAVFKIARLESYEIANNPESKFFIEFFQNLEDDKLLMEIIKDLYRNYFSFPYEERRNIISNTLVFFWNNKSLYINKLWLDFFDVLVEVIYEAIKKEAIEDLMPLHFLAYHIYGNNIQTIDEWRIFNEKVEKKASEFYKNWAIKNGLKSNTKGDKKRIGFLVDRIVLNSPFMVFYSLLKSLMSDENFRKNYEVYVYSMEYLYKQMDREYWIRKLAELGVKVYTPAKFRKEGFHFSHLQKALDLRERIIKDDIFYLINTVSGYDISNFILSTRTSPKQIYWSHGNCAFDIEGIDKRISHFEQECKEFKWDIFNVQLADEFLIGNEDEKKKGEAIKKSLLEEFGEDTVILGTIGRLVKIDSDEYLSVISKIMKENPNTIYLACGKGGKSSVEKKLKKHGIDRDRFIFAGMVNPHIFGWVIDVWPDTFPLGGGHSRDEFIAKKKPVVFHIKRSEKYADYEKGEFLAYTDEEYIEKINRLVKDEEYRKYLGELEYKVWIEERNRHKKDFLEIIGDENV